MIKKVKRLMPMAFLLIFITSQGIAQSIGGDGSTRYDNRLCSLRPQHTGTECQVVLPSGLCKTQSRCA